MKVFNCELTQAARLLVRTTLVAFSVVIVAFIAYDIWHEEYVLQIIYAAAWIFGLCLLALIITPYKYLLKSPADMG